MVDFDNKHKYKNTHIMYMKKDFFQRERKLRKNFTQLESSREVHLDFF